MFKKQIDLVSTSGDKTFFEPPPLPQSSEIHHKKFTVDTNRKIYIYIYSLCYCMLALRLQKFHSMIVAIF